MSEVLNGDSSHVTTPLVAKISSLADNGSGAVRVTTAAPHLFGPSDLVDIFTPVLSGQFRVTIISATQFDLVGSTFSSTSTGTATDLSLTPQVQVPTDGDTASLQLSGMLSAQQAMLDRDQYLNDQLALGGFPSSLFAQAFTFAGGSGGAAVGTVARTTILAETTAGPPCKLQTSAPHNYLTGMTVRVTGATGDTTINGAWPITVTDSTHFTIPITGAGGYTASSAHAIPIVPAGCHFVILDGWGGGGGGEGGGGHAQVADDTGSAFQVTRVQGGGGAGAKRRTQVRPVTPGDTWGIAGGAGGGGGVGAGASIATQGNAGGSLNYTDGVVTSLMQFHGGMGGGAGAVWIVAPHSNDAIVAFGGSGDTSAPNRPWPRALGVPSVLAMWKYTASVGSNIGTWISNEMGAGGPAVAPYATSLGFNASQPGVGQDRWSGGLAGTAGTDAAGSPNYIGGPGGGGGGAGPTGPGGAAGNGSNANGSGNSTVGSNADTTFATGATGAGGGGGGNAGAASGTVGNGGNGAGGDSGQITVCFIQTPTPSTQ